MIVRISIKNMHIRDTKIESFLRNLIKILVVEMAVSQAFRRRFRETFFKLSYINIILVTAIVIEC